MPYLRDDIIDQLGGQLYHKKVDNDEKKSYEAFTYFVKALVLIYGSAGRYRRNIVLFVFVLIFEVRRKFRPKSPTPSLWIESLVYK